VPGEDYALFVHVPEGMAVSRVRASVEGGREIPARDELTSSSLRVGFGGQPEAVAWQLEFAAKAVLSGPRDEGAPPRAR
jgi:hypothetical protein